MMGKQVPAWSRHREETGLGGCEYPHINMITSVSASVANSGVP